jgi:hypothetical protein
MRLLQSDTALVPNAIVTAYNINDGKNSELLGKCKTLHDYSAFIAKAREYEQDNIPKDIAVQKAIEYCKRNNILFDYLENNGSEVVNMLMQEWNWDTAFRVQREEVTQETIFNMVTRMLNKHRPLDDIIDITGIPESEIRAYANQQGLSISQ